MQQAPASNTYAAFAGAVIIGGTNFIAVSFSNRELPPLFGAALRFALAALLFFLIARAWRVPLARGRSAAGAAIYGILGFGAAYAFLYYSLVGLAAGTAAVIIATVPLFTLAIAVLLGQERLSLRGVVGGVLVVIGIAIVSHRSRPRRDRYSRVQRRRQSLSQRPSPQLERNRDGERDGSACI
jgi:drug/metabolite transporter (DMT)-like permease